MVSNTSAASANPYGSADYCALENNTTVIYGWAADPDARALSQPAVNLTVGNVKVTANTNRADYRDEAVTDWIRANRTGDPAPGAYGFRAAIPGIYKGTRHRISGTVLNEGRGANTILNVNRISAVDGVSKRLFFMDGVIPQACLAEVGTEPSATAVVSLLNPAASAPLARAESRVVSGTLAAEIRLDTADTAFARLQYGRDSQAMDRLTPPQPVGGSEAVILLDGLNPATTYSYQVIRKDRKGKEIVSDIGSFTTLGYVAAVRLVDSRNSGIEGIPVKVSGQSKPVTTDETGLALVTGISDGTHTLSYEFLGRNFQTSLVTDKYTIPASEAKTARVVTINQTIDIEKPLEAVPVAPTRRSIIPALLVAGILGAIILGAFISVWRRKLREQAVVDWPEEPPKLPEFKSLSPAGSEVVDIRPAHAEHLGQSLKSLVKATAKDTRRADSKN